MFFEKLKCIISPRIKKSIKILIEIYFRKRFIKQLKSNTKKCKKICDYVDLVFSFEIKPFGLFSINIKPAQVKEEISKFLGIIEEKRPHTILEIGTANGGTLYLFSQIASENSTIISVDLPEGKFGGGYPKAKIPLYKSFTKENQRIYLIRADSHASKTLAKVKEILNNQTVDFLFIDGDHTYEGVKKDFEMYSSLVKRGGIIGFHDIVHHPFVTGCQVEKFWKEIKQKYKTKEVISSANQIWAGIGIIFT